MFMMFKKDENESLKRDTYYKINTHFPQAFLVLKGKILIMVLLPRPQSIKNRPKPYQDK